MTKCTATAITCLAAALAAWAPSHTTALSSSYVHDGWTTYCWRIPVDYQDEMPPTKGVVKGQGVGCPVSMTIELQNTTVVTVGAFVSIKWTITLERARFKTNVLKIDKLYQTMDNSRGEMVDIIHSNVHSCAFGSNCDPFQKGVDLVDNTPNQRANFSSSSTATATDTVTFSSQNELIYSKPGEYSVLAHIIMGSPDKPGRTDYAVYKRLSVVQAQAANPSPVAAIAGGTDNSISSGSSDSKTGLSSTGVAIIIIGVVVVLALLAVLAWFLRRSKHKAETAREVPPISFFHSSTTNTPQPQQQQHQRSLDKAMYDYFTEPPASQLQIDPQAGHPKMRAPKAAPYVQFKNDRPTYHSQLSSSSSQNASNGSSQSIEPALYNREVASSRYMGESTRSYLFEVAAPAPPPTNDKKKSLPKIFDSHNSMDFVYPDTDRSIDMVDSTVTFNYSDLHDSSRTNETDDYAGFLVESTRSSVLGDHDDLDLSNGSSTHHYDTDSGRSFTYDDELNTKDLNTHDLRRFKVEI